MTQDTDYWDYQKGVKQNVVEESHVFQIEEEDIGDMKNEMEANKSLEEANLYLEVVNNSGEEE